MIIVRLSGGMGNQMFQYAAGRALAEKYGVPLALDTTFLLHRISYPHFLRPHFVFRDFDLDVFSINATIAKPSDIRWWNRPILWGKLMLGIDALLRTIAIIPGWEKRLFYFDERIFSLGPNAYLAGFWQNVNYFSSIAGIIKKDFALKDPLPERTQQLLDEVRESDSVCVHVRRSDMAAKSFHGAPDADYYLRAVEYIARHASIGKLYVFSDDIDWCKNNFRFPHPTVFVGHEYAGKKGEGHLALMSACKHFIIPNSTFSWWAAWLGATDASVVIVPKQWIAQKSLDTNGLIPKGWIRL
jgi:hypothetical protein